MKKIPIDYQPLVIIDSREPEGAGWEPHFSLPTIRQRLDVGDVSLSGLETYLALERKTAPDLAACLTWERERFIRELERSRALQFFRIVVECDAVDFRSGRFLRRESRANPTALWESMTALSIRFDTSFLFASDCVTAAALAESLMQKWLYEHWKCLETARKAARLHTESRPPASEEAQAIF